MDGEMTSKEVATFEAQVKTDPDLAYEVRLHELAVEGVQYSEEARFQEFKSRMKTIESEAKDSTPVVQLKPKRSGAVRWAMRIAAVLMPLLLLYFLFPFTQKQNNPLADTSTQLIELHIGNSRGETPPTPEATLLDEAIQLFKQEDYQAAIPVLDRVISETKQAPQALFLKADALYRLGKKSEARSTLNEVLNQNDEALKEKARAILDKL